MLPFENTVADYIDNNPSNHVLYRMTSVYKDKNDPVAYLRICLQCTIGYRD